MDISSVFRLFKHKSHDDGWVAIVIGRRGVHLARVNQAGNRPQVQQCTFHPLEEVSASALEKIVKEAHAGDARFTTLLSASEYQMLMVDAPNVPVDELKTAIRWKIKDSLNYHIDDTTVDVLQIPINKYGGDRPQSLYAVAAFNETIRKRIALFEKAGIALSVIDIPEMAQRNVAALYEEPGRGLALLSFGDDGGLLTITCDGELFLARRIDISLGQLQDADENLRQQFQDRVELEVQRSLDYCDRQFHYIQVTRMLLAAPEHIELDKRLAANLGVPVQPLELAGGLDIAAAPELAYGEFASQALLALGAALRQEKKAL